MSRGRASVVIALCTVVALACTPIAQTEAVAPNAVPSPASAANDPVAADPGAPLDANPPQQAIAASENALSCVERVGIPQIDNAFEASWSDDSNRIAVSRIVTIPNPRMITGTEEDQRISVVDLAKGTVRDLGQGSEPVWSGTGTYLAFWRNGDDDLRILRGDRLAGLVPATQPDVRWVGDQLFFFHNGEIRTWKDGVSWTVANVLEELAPRYPRDDVYFSADAQRFTMTRYYTDGSAERFLGVTSSGVMEPLGDGNTLFTQWAPVGHSLLLRSANAVTLRSESAKDVNASLLSLVGPVHAWTPDGRLLFGKMSPTVPGEGTFDPFSVFGEEPSVATLPNLLGARSFSPDGRFFMGVTRTGLYSTQLEVYRCGTVVAGTRPDTTARAHAASVDADPRRFVRPASGAITQYLQGSHTGIDVAAPYGSILEAADDGVVSAVGWVPVGGRRVCVQHADGLESCDYHTSLPLVSIGDRVLRGQPVALIGMTGLTTGPHVHWEAKRNGMIVDPLGR